MPSTAIRDFRYDAQRRALDVTFVTGRRYRYFAVPEEIARGLAGAFSKGRYFNGRIRDRFRHCELDRQTVPAPRKQPARPRQTQ